MNWYDRFNRYIIGLLPILVPLYVITLAIQLLFTNIMLLGETDTDWMEASWVINSLASFLFGLLLAGVGLVLVGILLEMKSRTK